jgi:hypothetical protein
MTCREQRCCRSDCSPDPKITIIVETPMNHSTRLFLFLGTCRMLEPKEGKILYRDVDVVSLVLFLFSFGCTLFSFFERRFGFALDCPNNIHISIISTRGDLRLRLFVWSERPVPKSAQHSILVCQTWLLRVLAMLLHPQNICTSKQSRFYTRGHHCPVPHRAASRRSLVPATK